VIFAFLERDRGVVEWAMSDERRYDDREVGLILKRVAELHEREGGKSDVRAMTRGEIEEVVTELGISRALVARAAADLSLQDLRNRPVWHLGGKTDVMLEEVVAGPVDESLHTRMLEVLRRHLGEPGKLEREGGATIWSTSGADGRQIHFTVVEHAGQTTLRLEQRMESAAYGTVGASTFAGGFFGFMLLVPLKVLVIKSLLLLLMGPLAFMGALLGWLGGRMAWARLAGERETVLRRVFAELVDVTVHEGKRPALAAAGEPDGSE
jgi:hypothetical protein